jgi:hypothetical protein
VKALNGKEVLGTFFGGGPQMRMLGCLLVAIALVGCGCGTGKTRKTPEYPVYWQADKDYGPGFYLYVKAGRIFQQPGSSTEDKHLEPREFTLLVWNHTGTPVFLARIGDHVLASTIYYSTRFAKGGGGGTAFPVKFGCGGAFDYLDSAPKFNEGECNSLGHPSVEVKFSIPWHTSMENVEVELSVPLFYFAKGADEPADVFARKWLPVE